MKRSTQKRRLKWNLRQMSSALLRRELGIYASRGGQHCIVAHPGGSNLQHAAETCEFSQVPPLSMGL